MVLYLFTAFCVLALGSVFLWTWFSAGPYTPIPYKLLDSLLGQLELEPGQKFYDLGAGDGRVVRRAAERFGVEGRGYELHPLVWLVGVLRMSLSPARTRVRLHLKNLFHVQIGEADVVFVHLLPHSTDRLVRKLVAELRPGARVVSYGGQLSALTYEKTLELPSSLINIFPTAAYLYRINT